MLCATPEGNIVQVLRDLQAAPEPLAYLAAARGVTDKRTQGRRISSDTSMTGSLHSLSRTELDVDGLAARYQIAYPALPPMQPTTDDLQPCSTVPMTKPELSQTILNVGGPASSNPAALLQAWSDSTGPLGSLTTTLAGRLCTPEQLATPISARRATPSPYIDERLHRLQIGYWTSVPISNDFAATVISSYLKVDHLFYAFFDADLFLQSLVNQETTFCGPFLVSSLLSQACVSCHT